MFDQKGLDQFWSPSAPPRRDAPPPPNPHLELGKAGSVPPGSAHAAFLVHVLYAEGRGRRRQQLRLHAAQSAAQVPPAHTSRTAGKVLICWVAWAPPVPCKKIDVAKRVTKPCSEYV